MAPHWTKEDQLDHVKSRRKSFGAFALASILMYTAQYYVLNGQIDLAPGVKGLQLKDFQSKIQFTLQYSVLGILWLFFALWNVMSRRFPTPALNPLAGHEHLIYEAKNILSNSFEQFLISFLSQLCLAAYLDGEMTKRVIPLMSWFYLIGRIFFFVGYPRNRSLGFAFNLIPTQLAAWICFRHFLGGIWQIQEGLGLTIASWGIPIIFHTIFHLKSIQIVNPYDKKSN